MRFIPLVLAVCSLVFQVAQGAETKGLKIVLTTDKALYGSGESIALTLKIINPTPRQVRLSFTTSQRFDLFIQDQEGREVWRWSGGRFFAQVLGEEVLKPSGGEILYRATAKEKFLPGVFTVKAIIPAIDNAMDASVNLTVK